LEYLGAIFALVGVGFGAALSFVSARANADRAWKREAASRLADLRRSAYAEYAQALKEEVRICRRVAGTRGDVEIEHALSREDGLRDITSANPRRSAALESVLLVGSSEVVESARVWNHAAVRLRRHVFDLDEGVQLGFADLYRRCGVARDGFYAAARADLAVTGQADALSPDELERRWLLLA
jgi:hypothetical protein